MKPSMIEYNDLKIIALPGGIHDFYYFLCVDFFKSIFHLFELILPFFFDFMFLYKKMEIIILVRVHVPKFQRSYLFLFNLSLVFLFYPHWGQC